MTQVATPIATLIVCLGLSLASSAPARADATHSLDAQVVSCQLPPQIRRLGQNSHYLAAGRITTTTVADCRVRGGQARLLPASQAAPPAAAPLAKAGTMAVMVGGDRRTAACAVSGEIVGLKAGSTLSVRAGPGTDRPRLDQLANGRRVYVCDGSADEAWLGIVYPARAGQDCGVVKASKRAKAYAGPCPMGWVNAGWVRTDGAGAATPN